MTGYICTIVFIEISVGISLVKVVEDRTSYVEVLTAIEDII